MAYCGSIKNGSFPPVDPKLGEDLELDVGTPVVEVEGARMAGDVARDADWPCCTIDDKGKG